MLLHDHSKVRYLKSSDISPGGYTVLRGHTLIGYVRKSPNGPGWSYQLDPDSMWTYLGPGSTRELATDHLLSAYSPSAAWLV